MLRGIQFCLDEHIHQSFRNLTQLQMSGASTRISSTSKQSTIQNAIKFHSWFDVEIESRPSTEHAHWLQLMAKLTSILQCTNQKRRVTQIQIGFCNLKDTQSNWYCDGLYRVILSIHGTERWRLMDPNFSTLLRPQMRTVSLSSRKFDISQTFCKRYYTGFYSRLHSSDKNELVSYPNICQKIFCENIITYNHVTRNLREKINNIF